MTPKSTIILLSAALGIAALISAAAWAGEAVPPVERSSPPVLLRRLEPRVTSSDAGSPFVVLQGRITKEGRVTRIRVLRKGTRRFTRACVEAFSRWRYRPALLNGRPVSVHITVTFQSPKSVST